MPELPKNVGDKFGERFPSLAKKAKKERDEGLMERLRARKGGNGWKVPLPQTDPEWSSLPDEDLATLEELYPDNQRVSSERAARRANEELRDKFARMKGESSARLAVNCFDIDRLDSQTRQLLFGGGSNCRFDLSGQVQVGKGDERGIVLRGDLLTLALALDWVRSQDREVGDVETRVYVKDGRGVWRRVPRSAVLTEEDEVLQEGDGSEKMSYRLNPELFPDDVEKAPPGPPPEDDDLVEVLDDSDEIPL